MATQPVDIATFIRNLEREFDNGIPGGLHPSLRLEHLSEWTSLQALIVVAGFERDYGVTISTADLDRAETVADLYRIIAERIGT